MKTKLLRLCLGIILFNLFPVSALAKSNLRLDLSASPNIQQNTGLNLNPLSPKEPNCINTAYDQDGDGYAEIGATANVYVNHDGIECPAPYISSDHATDCDDSDADTHPNATEKSSDGIDQDCDGIADDPYIQYDTDISRVTSDSINFTLVIKHKISITKDTYYEIEFFPLDHSGSTTVKGKLKLPSSIGRSAKKYSITLEDLEPATVYAMKIKIYEKSYLGIYNYKTETADWFYSTTNSGSINGLEHSRTQMLLNGFKQLGDSEIGLIGYAGSAEEDGLRFGADLSEMWCTEFYTYVTDEWFGFYSEGLSSSSAMINAFKDAGSYYASYDDSEANEDNVPDFVKTDARRGDYLAEDSNGDGDIDNNHSAMFLAWDEDTGKFWTLDGNADSRGGNGNYVEVNQNTFSYANSADNNGDTAYRVVGVGKITCGMVGANCNRFELNKQEILFPDRKEVPEDLSTLDELKPLP